jgi:hypothetical protein
VCFSLHVTRCVDSYAGETFNKGEAMKVFRLRDSDLNGLPRRERRNYVGERWYNRHSSTAIYNTEYIFEPLHLIRECIARHGSMQAFLEYNKRLSISKKRRRK